MTTTETGNLTGDPELRFIQSGHAVVNFTIARTTRTKKGDQWVDGDTTFLRCTAWRELAENIAESFTKGMRVTVIGELKTRSWEKDGQQHSTIELDVEECGPSLRWATAKVTRTNRKSTPQVAEPDPWATGEPPF